LNRHQAGAAGGETLDLPDLILRFRQQQATGAYAEKVEPIVNAETGQLIMVDDTTPFALVQKSPLEGIPDDAINRIMERLPHLLQMEQLAASVSYIEAVNRIAYLQYAAIAVRGLFAQERLNAETRLGSAVTQIIMYSDARDIDVALKTGVEPVGTLSADHARYSPHAQQEYARRVFEFLRTPAAGQEEVRQQMAQHLLNFVRVYGPTYGHKQGILQMHFTQGKPGVVQLERGILRAYQKPFIQSMGIAAPFDDHSVLAGQDRPELQLTTPYAILGAGADLLEVPIVLVAENEAVAFPVHPDHPVAVAAPTYTTCVMVLGRGLTQGGVPALLKWHYLRYATDPVGEALQYIARDLPNLLQISSEDEPLTNIQIALSAEQDVADLFNPSALAAEWAAHGVSTVTLFPRQGAGVVPVATTDAFGLALAGGICFLPGMPFQRIPIFSPQIKGGFGCGNGTN